MQRFADWRRLSLAAPTPASSPVVTAPATGSPTTADDTRIGMAVADGDLPCRPFTLRAHSGCRRRSARVCRCTRPTRAGRSPSPVPRTPPGGRSWRSPAPRAVLGVVAGHARSSTVTGCGHAPSRRTSRHGIWNPGARWSTRTRWSRPAATRARRGVIPDGDPMPRSGDAVSDPAAILGSRRRPFTWTWTTPSSISFPASSGSPPGSRGVRGAL